MSLNNEDSEWLRVLRKRSHEMGNQINRVEGMVTGFGLLMEERHKTMRESQNDLKMEFRELNKSVDSGFNDVRIQASEIARQVSDGKIRTSMITSLLTLSGAAVMSWIFQQIG